MFAPDTLVGSAEVYSHLQQQRRDQDFWEVTEDPKVHDALLGAQKQVLDHLLHPVVMKRITDSRLYGNEYELAMFLDDLTGAIFAADARSEVNTFRQNLQIEYVKRLVKIVGTTGTSTYDYPSQSMALYQLRSVRRLLQSKQSSDIETRAHTDHVLFLIERALEPRKV